MSKAVEIKGMDKLKKKLERLERRGAKAVVRKAARAGGTVLLRGVRSSVPVNEGLVKKMMALKVSNRGLSATSIVGADVARLQNAANAPEESPEHRPSNIDHLLEYGHVNRDGSFTPPTGFMRYAADATMPAAEAAYTSKLASEIEREAMR